MHTTSICKPHVVSNSPLMMSKVHEEAFLREDHKVNLPDKLLLVDIDNLSSLVPQESEGRISSRYLHSPLLEI